MTPAEKRHIALRSAVLQGLGAVKYVRERAWAEGRPDWDTRRLVRERAIISAERALYAQSINYPRLRMALHELEEAVGCRAY